MSGMGNTNEVGAANRAGKMSCDVTGSCLPELPKTPQEIERFCAINFARKLMDTARRESCGKCVLCREGTWQSFEIIHDITEGKGQNDDFELLTELLEQIGSDGGCEMSVKAASLCLGLLRNYQEEWDLHIRRKRCANLICKASYTVHIAPELCDGCGKCIGVCPDHAILGGGNLIHVIQGDRCSKCMLCAEVCPKGAVKKAGAVKPKVPAEPIPVGSFSGAGGSSEEGPSMRRRRRGE
ncbi:MAG: hypothetical protein K0R19_2319 [Bacillota bacterium]|jgi:NADH-quinone oxidoreductase subunit F|nr:hypothetical protein [Bacillota bacterium]